MIYPERGERSAPLVSWMMKRLKTMQQIILLYMRAVLVVWDGAFCHPTTAEPIRLQRESYIRKTYYYCSPLRCWIRYECKTEGSSNVEAEWFAMHLVLHLAGPRAWRRDGDRQQHRLHQTKWKLHDHYRIGNEDQSRGPFKYSSIQNINPA